MSSFSALRNAVLPSQTNGIFVVRRSPDSGRHEINFLKYVFFDDSALMLARKRSSHGDRAHLEKTWRSFREMTLALFSGRLHTKFDPWPDERFLIRARKCHISVTSS